MSRARALVVFVGSVVLGGLGYLLVGTSSPRADLESSDVLSPDDARGPRAGRDRYRDAGAYTQDAAGLPEPGTDPVPLEFAPRDPEEWQGMPINVTFQSLCDVSERCGLAMACLSGRCGPCASDTDCGAGEVCVLQHCLREPNASCRSQRDCASGVLCMMNGYSLDPRGNSDLRSVCAAPDDLSIVQLVGEPRSDDMDGSNRENNNLDVAHTGPIETGSPQDLLDLLRTENR